MTNCTACGWAGDRTDGKDWSYCPSCGNPDLNIGQPIAWSREGDQRLLRAIVDATAHDQQAGATWATIERKARDGDPILARVVMHAEHYGREAALVQAVVYLADLQARRVQEDIDRLALSPVPPFLLRKP